MGGFFGFSLSNQSVLHALTTFDCVRMLLYVPQHRDELIAVARETAPLCSGIVVVPGSQGDFTCAFAAPVPVIPPAQPELRMYQRLSHPTSLPRQS